MSKSKVILTIVAVLGLLGGTSQAAVVIEHVHDNNPTGEGWTEWWGQGVADSLGGEAGWRLDDADGLRVEGIFAANPGLLTEGWVLEARMAVLAPPIGGNDVTWNVLDGSNHVQSGLDD